VVKGAPAHPKVPDALLKIGYLFYDQKNYAKARETLNKVKEQFPGSQAANLADQRLKRMQQEGV
jgi:TolA-binding protein